MASQAFPIAEDVRIKTAQFEGDALQVILSLRRMEQFSDWRARQNIMKDRELLRNHSFWSINYVNRNCNICVHKLTAWARNSVIYRKLDVTTLPAKILCDQGGSDIILEDDDLNEI